jgi:hypothetical protein
MKEYINSKEIREIFSKIKDVMIENKDFLFNFRFSNW